MSQCCPPPPPPPCPQTCPPAPGPPVCRTKPLMKGLQWSLTMRIVYTALAISSFAGVCVYTFLGVPRKAAYRDYYRKAEMEDIADGMARRGLFDSVPRDSVNS